MTVLCLSVCLRTINEVSRGVITFKCFRHNCRFGYRTMGFHKSTLVTINRGADTQLDPSCVSAPLATNVDLLHLLRNGCLNYLQLAVELA